MTDQYLDLEDREVETKIVGNLYQYHVELLVSSKVVEVVAFEAETKELFSYARYEKTERQLLYSLRYDALHACIRDIVLYDRMEGYEA